MGRHRPEVRARAGAGADAGGGARRLLARLAAERRMPPAAISEEAMAALQAHDWPGNVRQLRNIIERTVILAPTERLGRIEVDMLPAEVLDSGVFCCETMIR